MTRCYPEFGKCGFSPANTAVQITFSLITSQLLPFIIEWLMYLINLPLISAIPLSFNCKIKLVLAGKTHNILNSGVSQFRSDFLLKGIITCDVQVYICVNICQLGHSVAL